MQHAYETLLRLYPDGFRRRYAAEMSLDFADGWAEARVAGLPTTIAFCGRVAGDLIVSLLREWTRGVRLAMVAATTSVTLCLWGVALRPWGWKWDVQPGPRHPGPMADVTAGELIGLAAAAMIPVLLVLLFATRMVKRSEPSRRRF